MKDLAAGSVLGAGVTYGLGFQMGTPQNSVSDQFCLLNLLFCAVPGDTVRSKAHCRGCDELQPHR